MNERHRIGLSLLATGLALSLAVVACSSEADGGGGAHAAPGAGGAAGDTTTPASGGNKVTTATGLPCDVDAVLKTHCQTCHASEPKYGASTPLVTYADLQKPGVLDRVKERIHDDARPMPPSPQPRLDAKELATMDAWFSAGAKPSDATCTNDAPGDAVKPLSCKPDTFLKSTKPFTMQPDAPSDQYVCFGVDVNLPKKRHVIGFAPQIDNKQIVHHILLFQTDQAESTEPFACQAFGSAAWKLVAGWAPGGNNLELPKEAGFPQPAGTTHWVLQVHYNNTNAKTGTDQSGYQLCTTEDLRPNDSGVLAFGSINFSIPPRSTYTQRCDYKLGSEFDGVTFFNASPHMHTLGSAMSTERLAGGDGTPEMVFEQKAFSFEAQENYKIAKTVAANDVIRTRCTWKNPTDATVTFGEKTGDEMCFDFIGYYPAIPDRTVFGLPIFTWVTPSQNASCASE